MTIFHFVQGFVALWTFLLVFYTLYLAAVNLWHNRSSTNIWVIVGAFPVILVMLAVDFVAQISVATIAFADLPQEWTVSERLIRYRAKGYGWRFKIATWICTNALNPFDPTKHHC